MIHRLFVFIFISLGIGLWLHFGCNALFLWKYGVSQAQPIPGTILVRHAPQINGRIEGNLQQLSSEDVTLNGGAIITGDLLVPGTPTVVKNGNPNLGSVVDGMGNPNPTNYRVLLNGNVTLSRLVRRVDPVPLSTIASPSQPTGTRDVILNNPNDPLGDLATLRNLTLNGNAGTRTIPPGTYGNFIINGNNGLVLGTVGTTQREVYNLQNLVLNGNTQLQVVGPIVLTVPNSITINSLMGSSAHPSWLQLRVANGGLTLNGGSQLNGGVFAPNGSVIINGRLQGTVECDRLTINGGGVLQVIPWDKILPNLIITQPSEGTVISDNTLILRGSLSDASPVIVKVNNVPVTIDETDFVALATVPLNEGPNTLTIVATDAFFNATTISRNIILDSVPPALSITTPSEGASLDSAQVNVTGKVTDATATTVLVNQIRAVVNGSTFSATAPLTAGTNLLLIHAEDAAGNYSEVKRFVNHPVSLALKVEEPLDRTFTGRKAVEVLGSFAGAGVTITANGTPVRIDQLNGTFFKQVPITEGNNTIRIVATDASGRTQEVVRTVIVDTQPPVISNLTPENGALISTPTVTIQGTITDMSPVAVTVDGITASINSGQFTAVHVPIDEGPNYIPILAIDAAGNSTSKQLFLKGQDHTAPAPPVVFSAVSPTRLAFQMISGRAEPGSQITISGITPTVTTSATTDVGLFFANVPLVIGINTLRLTATDALGNISPVTQISITSNPVLPSPPVGQPNQINISIGDGQRGLVKTELPRPLVVLVTDVQGNPVPGTQVQFTMLHGGGHFVGGTDRLTLISDNQGRIAARYISGDVPGVQVIKADFTGNTSASVEFLAIASDIPSTGVTRFSGVVVDENLRALPHVLIRLGGQQTRTGSDGNFVLENISSGPHQLLEVIGRDQVPFPGRWPNISYDIDVLPGITNPNISRLPTPPAFGFGN